MENRKCVALTFDDGPSNITERVLDILEENKIPGTFFLIGEYVTPDKKPILERELSLGCELANHSFTHQDMTKMAPEAIAEEIRHTSQVIRDLVNAETRFFRPPYILVNDAMYDNIPLPFICGLDSRDWDPASTADDRYHNVVDHVQDGSLVLMHDLKDNEKTLEALPMIISTLREQGYSFVTASQIFEEKQIDPHASHKLWSCVFD